VSDRPHAKDYALAALTPPPAHPTPDGLGPTFDFAQPAGPFVAGTVFAGRYRIVAPLGSGGLGHVWRADDLVLQTPVALKVLPPGSAEARNQVLEEVRLSRLVTHPAVCRVFDVGEADGSIFYSMELVGGEDLATLLRRTGPLPVEKVVDIGGQLCDALDAAHAQRIIHGNLKPSNVLIDPDGFVRVTDFGFTAEASNRQADAAYRAPELQAAGAQPSEQTDIYAVAAILYQLLGDTAPATADAAGKPARPVKLSRLVPEISLELERTITDALSRDPRKRPASAARFAERLRGQAVVHQRNWAWLAATSAVVLLAVAAFLLFYPRNAAPLSDRDTIVVADFTNTTGETVFDGALKVALAVALEQSPFLKVFPDERVRDTLRLMERSPDERITRALARDIAVREQLKALVAGSISKLGNSYVLTLEALNAQSGDVIAREQAEVKTREDVLAALGSSAATLRSRLGESLASIQRFDVPLARATTPSLEALHAYSLALDDGRMNLRTEAIPHLERAIELDPRFALAQAMLSGIYANTGRSAEAPVFARRAFELRDRVSERERFFISWRYYIDSAQAWDEALALAAVWTRTYPREAFAFNSLAIASGAFGQHRPAIDALHTALQLDPRFLPPYGNLVGSLIALGRYDEAQAAIRDARARKIDATSLHRGDYVIALVRNDEAAMAAALAKARTSNEAAIPSYNWEAHTTAFRGHIQAAHALFQRAIDEAMRAGRPEQAAQWTAEDAETHALAEDCGTARTEASAAVVRSRDNFTLERAARTLAWCGDETDARALDAELGRRFPEATLTRQIQRPLIAALLAIDSQPSRVVDVLDAVRPYDSAPSAEFWTNYVRGLAYLRLKDGQKAAAEFQRILTHRGEAPGSMLYPLATLGSARAAAMSGDPERARTAYTEFLELWSEADATLPAIKTARQEMETLR
jgi:eukaryotic-like serine/threonine-protein kinase